MDRRAPGLHAQTRMGCVLLALCCAAVSAEAESQAELDLRLAQIGEAVAQAHFRSALALAESTRGALDALPVDDLQAASRRARLELLAASAEVALGRSAQARACLVRALRADPALALDEGDTSPKLLRLLPEARRLAARAEGGP